MMTTTITSTKRMTRRRPNATTNPNATKIAGDMDKNNAGLHMYPLLEAIYGDIFDPTNDG